MGGRMSGTPDAFFRIKIDAMLRDAGSERKGIRLDGPN